MDIADRLGSDFRRRLRSAERFKEAAIAFGLFSLNTPCSRSSASLRSVPRRDHFRGALRLAREAPRARRGCGPALLLDFVFLAWRTSFAAIFRPLPKGCILAANARRDKSVPNVGLQNAVC